MCSPVLTAVLTNMAKRPNINELGTLGVEFASVPTMEVVAHRAGNSPDAAGAAQGLVDMIELDVHVLRGQVEVRHAKVLRPTRRLWEKWYFLPRGSVGVPIDEVLSVLDSATPLMIDLKCFTRRSSRLILRALPAATPIVASTRNWWVLTPFRGRPKTRRLRSCGTKWQLWWVLHRSAFDAGDGVCLHEHRLNAHVMTALHERTKLVFSWGAETVERASELGEFGLTGVIVDDYQMFGRAQSISPTDQ